MLGGGGPVGGAWLTGMLAGLTEAGVDPDTADVLIGTSAGAVFGARLRCGTPAAELYERQLSGADAVRLPVTTGQTARFLWAALGSRDPGPFDRPAGPDGAARPHRARVGRARHGRPAPRRGARLAGPRAACHGRRRPDREGGGVRRALRGEAVAASCAVPVV
ncbi:hypothetical protein ACPCAJ_13755 [Streptomyces griseoincarnatus]